MAQTASTMAALGSAAPDFSLPGTEGRIVQRDDFAAPPALLVAFWCNHCPFVKHVEDAFVRFAREYQPQGLAIVAISANDPVAYPEDSPAKMRETAQRCGYGFPYLFDESQAVARAYQAACTPDFFLYDAGRRLAYRGQFDGSRPGNTVPVTGADLRAAVAAVLAGRPAPSGQKPSLGCNIKWRP